VRLFHCKAAGNKNSLEATGKYNEARTGLMRLSAHGEPARIGKARFVVCLFSGTYKRFFCNFFSRAYIAYLIAGALFFISAQLFAQQPVVMEWPLTGMHQVAKPNPFSSLGFNTGKSVDSLQFTEEFGATTTGWNTDNPDPEAYYEYTITPAPGRSIEITRLNFEVSLSRVNMRTSVQYSYDGFRQQKVQIGHTIYVGTPMPRNLPVKTSLRVTYSQTLTIRVYGWSTVDHKVSFHNRNVVFEGMLFGKELIAQTLEETPAEPEVQELPLPEPEEQPVVSPEPDPLAAMAVITPGDTVGNGVNNLVKAPMAIIDPPWIQDTPGSYTFTVPNGVTSITVECWGAGGGGGRSTSNNSGRGGGGGGAYAGSTLSVTPGDTYTVVVGQGGTGGNLTALQNTGGSTIFGANLVVAVGGGGVANNSNTAGAGGLYTACIGAVRISGGNGANGSGGNSGGGGGGAGNTEQGGNASGMTAGSGGDNYGGNGGYGRNNQGSGNPGQSYGGGGGGGRRTSTTQNGGAGASGAIRITWVPAYLAQFNWMDFGSATWCSGETRTVSVNVTNIGQAPWTDAPSPLFDINIGVKWNTNGASWADYYVRTNANNLAPGETATYSLTIAASNFINGTGYTTPLATGINNLTFDVVKEGDCWFGNNNGSCGPGNSVFTSSNISIVDIPAQPSTILGPLSPCVGSSQTYSVTNVSGVSYNWSFPAGWTQTGGGTTNSVTVTVGATSGTITVTPSNACGNGTARTLDVTTTTVPAQPSAITGNTTPCAGTSQVYSVTNVSGITYNWTFPAGWTQTAGGTTNSVTVTVGATGGYVSATPSNGCGNGTASTLDVTPLNTPAQPSSISGNTSPCEGSSQVYSVTNTPGVTYTWTFPAGWTQTAGGNTNSVTVTVGTNSGNITVTPSNSCGNGTAQTLAVTVQSLPAQPGPIQPATSAVCQNSIHNFVVMPPAPAGVTYTWAFPGATVLSGQGTNVVQIRFGNQSGTLTVTPSNSCGNGTPQTMAISVSTSSPAMPGVIAGVIAPCIGSTKTYSIADLGFLYSWTVPAGWTILSGQGSNSITVTVGATAGNISVTAGNACGGSSPRNLAVTPQAAAPAQPSEITGTSPVCAGSTQTYSVTAVPFVVYDWSVPAGWAILTGQGSNTITCTAGATSGTITVTPSNDCGTGTSRNRTILVDVAPPAATSAITGNNNPCQNSTVSYSVAEVIGITYTWSFPADWTINSGQGSHEVEVTVGAISGNISVVPSNGCGNGPATQLAVNVFLLPLSAGDITGDREFCEGTQHIYSVVNVSGVTYTWSFPAGWAINSGQGTHSVNVTAGVNSGNIQVIPQNACGNGPASTMEVTVNPLPAAETGPDGAICVGASIMIGATGVPGNTYLWTADPAGEIFDFTGSHPIVRPAYTTTYTLTETNTVTGCSNTNSVTILANQVISLSVNPAEQTICSGNNTSIVITSNISGTIFEWEPTLTVGDPVTTTGYTNGSGPLINQNIRNVSGATSTVSYLIKATAEECENTGLHAIVHINPEPVVNGQSATLCSDAASGLILGSSTNGVAIASYEIISINSNGLTASAGNPAIGSGLNANVIADDAWTNASNNPVNVIYTVRPFSNAGCAGSNFTVTLTINPEPLITNANAYEICSGSATGINLTSSIPSTFQWTIGTITGGITGASAGSGSVINQVLTNPSNSLPGSVEYIVTPRSTSGTCFGNPVTITVTVNPGPVVTNSSILRICSGSFTGITLSASTAATFTWTIGTITGGITGASAGLGTSINQILTNPSNAASGTVEYRVVATSVNGGCVSPASTITVTVDPIPAVTASASPTEICPGEEFDLFSSSSLTWAPSTLLSENFNGATNNWTTSGSPTSAIWTLRPDGYFYHNLTYHSNDNSQFYHSNSRNNGPTDTYLQSPVINTNGYLSLSLDFYHYYRHQGNSRAYVQVSTNGTNWTNVATYSSTQGSADNFDHPTIDLSAYCQNTTFYIRFYYTADNNRYWAIDNVTLTGTTSNTIPIISWTSIPIGFISTEASPQNLTQTQTTQYTIRYTNPLSGCSSSASTTVITKPLPDAQITADYCIQANNGCIQLTASGGGTYQWNTLPTSTNPIICVDEAGIYSVTVTGTNGCVATAYLNASNELVTNGNFNSGNIDFITDYGYVADNPALQNELWPEGLYSVGTDGFNYHTDFFGRDRTNPGSGQFMIVNGLGNTLRIWQQTVTVVPGLDYYFSAYAMSVNDAGNYARLQFEVNGVPVGTIAELGPGPANNSQVSPSNWVRFYSDPAWESGTSTTAVIRIINLRPDLGGNDFALDDISFGTLDPIPFTFSPSVVGGNNIVCEGSDIELTANISGGLPPYTYNWSGPNGFTSTLANPVIPNATLFAAGTYTLVVSDSYGCDPQSGSVVVEILPAPDASISGGGDYCQFSGSPFIWFTATVGEPPFTFEYNINGGATQTVTTWGSDMSTFVIAPTSSTGTFVYTLTHVSDNNGCERDLNVSTTVVVHSLPSAYITGDLVVCPRSENIYSGNAGMSGYEWNITGNGSIPGQANQQLVTIEAGGNCDEAFTLLLTVADEHGCHATAEEVILVDDVDAPVISGSIPLTEVEGCSISDLPAAVTTIEGFENLGVAVSDNCNEDMLVLSHSDAAPSGHCPIVVVRTYTITDACGNQTNAEQTIHIDDTTPPLVDCNVSGTQQVNVNSGNVYIHPDDTWDAHASDNCPGTVTLTAMLTGDTESGPYTTLRDVTFNQGTTTVTWTATDECGNTSTCSFVVEVAGTADLEILKTGPATITAGETITWTINITNLGPAIAPSFRMEDNVPAQVTNPEYSIDGGTSWSLWTGSLSAGPLALGSDMEILIRGKVACDATDFTNTATVQLEVLTDPDTDNNTSSLATTIENELAVNAIIDNTLCPGNHDGRINITVSGGTAPHSFSWTGPNGFTSNQQNIANLEAGTYSLTVTDANGCTYTEDFVVESEPDTEPPTFTAPGPFDYCVINIISAQYDGQPEPAADIIPLLPEHGNPRRPDWYLVNSGSTELDVTNIADNCCDATDITISWTITFDPLVGGTLSGTGQPSLSTPMQLWGTAANVPVNHTITYTVTDCNGNVAATVSRNVLIRPRPEVIKLY
jgi:uncharacterized repeat protein (TIGR01451 family)